MMLIQKLKLVQLKDLRIVQELNFLNVIYIGNRIQNLFVVGLI